jgi:YycE-like N-terminal domain/YycE-like C-terminal domain
MPPYAILRIARPTDHLTALAVMYAKALDFTVLAQFHDHAGFDGVILGHPQHPYHLEFTAQRGHQVGRAPTKDHLLVFYIPDRDEWEASCARMLEAGFQGKCRRTDIFFLYLCARRTNGLFSAGEAGLLSHR